MPEGEIVTIVGSNGAGTTTLLRTISGLVAATGGHVRFAGHDITGAASEVVLGHGIAQVPEGRRLFKGLSVRDNLLLGAYLRTDSAEDIERDLEFVCSIFPILKERYKQDASTLSGGERDRWETRRGSC